MYVLQAGNPGSINHFSGERLRTAPSALKPPPTTGGTRVFYLRSNAAGLNSAPVPCRDVQSRSVGADHLPLHHGFGNSQHGAVGERDPQIFYATLDNVPLPAAGLVPGNSR